MTKTSRTVRRALGAIAVSVSLTASALAANHDFDGDGTDDYIVGYPVVADGLPVLGHARVYSGDTKELLFALKGAAPDDLFGLRADAAGDINNDGFDDIIVAAPLSGEGGTRSGAVYLFSGADGQLLRTTLGSSGEHIGRDVAHAGDIDGDGHADYAYSGFTWSDATSTYTGFVRIDSGATGATIATLTGEDASFGGAIASMSDLDNDGAPDFAVAAPSALENGAHEGAVYIYFGDPAATPAIGDLTVSDADVTLPNFGQADMQFFGASLFPGKDLNADGVREVVILSHALDANGEPEYRYEAIDITGLVVHDSGGSKPGTLGGGLQGDADGDGDVDIDDVLVTLTVVGGDADPMDPFGGDMDRDGDVDQDDLLIVSENLGTLDPVKQLAMPGSGVGHSLLAAGIPTPGELGCEFPGIPWGGAVTPGMFLPGSDGGEIEGICCEGLFGVGGEWYLPMIVPIEDPDDFCDPVIVDPGGGDGEDGGGGGPDQMRLSFIFGLQIVDQGEVVIIESDPGDVRHTQGEVIDLGNGMAMVVPEEPGEWWADLPEPAAFPSTLSAKGSMLAEQRAGLDMRGPNQLTTCPVLVSEGFKAERDVDLHVSLPGEDFELFRTYNGGLIMERPNFPWMVGKGWGTSADGWFASG